MESFLGILDNTSTGQVIFILALVIICVVTFTGRRKRCLPPGPRPLPLIGNLHQLGFRPYETYMKLGKKYGPIFSVDYASFPVIILNNHEIIRKVLNDGASAGRPKGHFFVERTGGKLRGIIGTELGVWAEQRRFLVKNLGEFGFGKKTMETQIMDSVQILVGKVRAQEGAPIQTEFLFGGAVLNSFWKIVSGEPLTDKNPEVANLLHTVSRSISNVVSTGLCFFFPTLNKLVPRLTGYDELITNSHLPVFRFLTNKITQKKETYNDEQPPQDLFDAYFKMMKKTTDPKSSFYGEEAEKQMAATVMDLFIAGMETTSTTLNWTFLILALYPEMQDKVHNEITINIKSRLPTISDRQSMPYTECFMMEVNRFAALVPLALFHCTTQEMEMEGYKIPKETWVSPNLFGVMHDPELWGDPEVIRPERFFTPEGEVDRHNPAYMPFSTGKRQCIGEAFAKDEIFLFLTSFCQAFWIKPNPNEVRPTLAHRPGFTLSPKPHSLIFEIRK